MSGADVFRTASEIKTMELEDAFQRDKERALIAASIAYQAQQRELRELSAQDIAHDDSWDAYGRNRELEYVKKFDNITDSDIELKQVGGSHYQMPIQPIEFIVKNGIPYREGNVIKYVTRHKEKNGKQDILKAIHYLEMILRDYL